MLSLSLFQRSPIQIPFTYRQEDPPQNGGVYLLEKLKISSETLLDCSVPSYDSLELQPHSYSLQAILQSPQSHFSIESG